VRNTPVPQFFLYGEPRRSVGPRFLHLEALEERSKPPDWTIRPHAHAELHHIFLIASGGGRMDADGLAVRFSAPCLLIVPARTVHGFAWERDTGGRVLTMADGYLRDLLARAPDFAALFAAPCCLTGGDAAGMEARLHLLGQELVWSAPGHEAAIDAHLLMVLVETLRLQRQAAEQHQPRPGRAVELVARFRDQLEANYRTGVSVQAQAAMLGVTQATLRRACLAVVGSQPVQLIQERLFLEAQRVLLYTNMSIGEAAAHLGFEDAAYFSRFFRRHAGASPRGFRAGYDAAGAPASRGMKARTSSMRSSRAVMSRMVSTLPGASLMPPKAM
jgi:AraC family transcriptional activator of pobA